MPAKARLFTDLINEKIAGLKGNNSQVSGFLSKDDIDEPPKDELDMASDIVQRSIDIKIIDSNRRQIFALQSALDRICDGSFGICEICDGEIPDKGLIARPESTLCLKCQEKREKEEKLSRSG